MIVLLQVGRVLLAALAVFWIISLIGWVPQALQSGGGAAIVRVFIGIAVALLPAWGYTALTKMVNARKGEQ